MRANFITLAAGMLSVCIAIAGAAAQSQTKTVRWNPNTLTLIAEGGGYGRMARLAGGDILCAFDRRGCVWTSRSTDDGETWSPAEIVVKYEFGTATNPELLQLANGWVLLSYNERPRDGKHHFAIRTSISTDRGRSWTAGSLAYQADTLWDNGCWEPAQIQLPSGEIQLYFANENPYRKSDEQEISLIRSADNGQTWSRPQTVCFRANHRDGMPVPLILNDGRNIVVAIEDNGINRRFRPAIVSTPIKDDWKGPYIDGGDPRRWWALAHRLPENVNAAAPYIRQFPSGETVLSCQIHEVGAEPVMAVYIGDEKARNFANKTIPFDVDRGKSGKWNALFIKNAITVTALSGTTIDGTGGLWAIDGKLTTTSHED